MSTQFVPPLHVNCASHPHLHRHPASVYRGMCTHSVTAVDGPSTHSSLPTLHSGTADVIACCTLFGHVHVQSLLLAVVGCGSSHVCPFSSHTLPVPSLFAHVGHCTAHSSNTHLSTGCCTFTPVAGARHWHSHVFEFTRSGSWQSWPTAVHTSFTSGFSHSSVSHTVACCWPTDFDGSGHTHVQSPDVPVVGSTHACPAFTHTVSCVSHSFSSHVATPPTAVPAFGDTQWHSQSLSFVRSLSRHAWPAASHTLPLPLSAQWGQIAVHSLISHVAAAAILWPVYGATHSHFQSDSTFGSCDGSTHVCPASVHTFFPAADVFAHDGQTCVDP
eukprot:Rhum_TRINITY_DN15284_c5_g2::Rhum_TRINITY_DN15284_c5_g2_i3::g.143993::m.143993